MVHVGLNRKHTDTWYATTITGAAVLRRTDRRRSPAVSAGVWPPPALCRRSPAACIHGPADSRQTAVAPLAPLATLRQRRHFPAGRWRDGLSRRLQPWPAVSSRLPPGSGRQPADSGRSFSATGDAPPAPSFCGGTVARRPLAPPPALAGSIQPPASRVRQTAGRRRRHL